LKGRIHELVKLTVILVGVAKIDAIIDIAMMYSAAVGKKKLGH
jgi:hypothetical protein